ncbi:hypothetical protein [Glycomyces dulcitolivorans]|uniref:hypothetical protein n=1 Tax=Glycomyces dulcitolivorans TaxID=2200759 RepID=UPI000DD3BEAD|nr:hypothetical protein [Glycomyces dulcitolivorans]
MSKRHSLAVLAAIGLAAAANPVQAEPPAEPRDDPGHSQLDAITLPTGDLVHLTADGSYRTEPADGTAAFHTAQEPDGDRLIVPVDALAALADGGLSLEQFNIDALARLGITDAGDPEAAELLQTETAPQGGEPALIQVDFTGLWPDGTAPDATFLRWIDVDTGEYNSEIFDGGTGTLELAPGHYQMVPSMDRFATQETVAGVLDVRVDAAAEPIVFDGAAATPVGFDTDREAETQWREFSAFSYLPGTRDGVQGGLMTDGDWAISVVPTDWDTTGRDVGFNLRDELTSPEGSAEPYSYSLYGQHTDGIPADPAFRVRDEDLARVEMDYDSLGVDARMYRVNLAVHSVYSMSGYMDSGYVDLPSTRTEFYSAGPDLSWSHLGILGLDSEDGQRADVMHHSGVLKGGSTTETGWNQGPVTVGLDLAGAAYFVPRFYRWEDADLLLTNPSMHSSGSPDEAVNNYETPGQTVLSQNGLGIAKSEYGGEMATELALVPAGRYDLYAESHRDVPWTVLGTDSTAEWSFATAPGTEDTVLPVSVVDFDAEGIENGFADADAPQQVTLAFATQPGAEQQTCTAMTFEVSYDDGATWTPVPIDRDGNTSTAELVHPAGAEFVSIRFTAADDAGNTVAHSTIRSYGLR